MPTLLDHYERYLGVIQQGWEASADGEQQPFQVVECRRGALQGVSAFATAGLSRYELKCDRVIRHELLFLAPTPFGVRNIPGILQQAGAEAIERGHPYLRGELIGPRGPLFDGKAFEALYVAIPVYLPDAFASFRGDEGYEIVIAWLVPVTRPEATYVRDKGWDAFEKLLERNDPDLLDFDRATLC